MSRQQPLAVRSRSPIPARAKRRSLTFWGLPLGAVALTAAGGMGTGAGVMALLLPPVPPQPTVAIKGQPAAAPALAERTPVLLPTADPRPIVAEVLAAGGRSDPFVATDAPQAVALPALAPAVPPEGSELASLVRPSQAMALLPAVPTGAAPHILPPPALVSRLLPLSTTAEAPGPLAALPPAPAAIVVAPPAAVDSAVSPSLVAIAAPEAAQAGDLSSWQLVGTALSGSNRIALLHTGGSESTVSVSEGQTVAGWLVKAIDEERIVLVQNDQQHILKIGG
ncbi:hypothetical protein [Gloeobacter kilaueensis]|uniref:hypothetical protein n=1 Tax=Gloeobacter kilaueensis TaxID=1416614 RepID=UPI0016518748|nr:hypothetical protein [Gloeobacter kilaueensis]